MFDKKINIPEDKFPKIETPESKINNNATNPEEKLPKPEKR